ncbi:hypothetical protein [Bradyrhizobium sp.]|uniref:hypothetical protein n=1 Tax=Bradyrhizobium sp. TaxID=376 RepID=UPI002D3D6B0E|nr:hypothetical protein [Bradyrhizobium sp.]HZR74868.1 hypothetical protein [Bradyrhizobium sp.]
MEGDTLANLQLGDPDAISTVVRVEVEAGSRPLTVVLESENSVIWDFEGAVERVESAIVVANGGRHPVAARGLPEQAIRFPDLAGCPPVILPPWQKRHNVEAYFGRTADRVTFEGKVRSLKLPDGEFIMPSGLERANARGTERELLMYHPGGLRIVDAKSIVSSAPVLEPETLPAEAGLLQLEKTGAIRRLESFEKELGGGRGVDYAILREMMLPPGLFGAHSKNFLVLAGVPAPHGNVGHGCLFFVDDPRKDSGHCRRNF